MANKITFCEKHNIEKVKMPEQYYCRKCKNEYQSNRNKRLLEESKRLRNQQNVTVEADPAKRNSETIVFD